MDKSLTIFCSISASSPFGCLGRHSMYVQVSSPSSDASPIPVLVFGTSHARHSYISKDPNFSFKEKTPSFCLALSLWRHRKIVWFLENCTAFSVCCLYLRDYIQPECSIIKLWCWNISSSLLASSFISSTIQHNKLLMVNVELIIFKPDSRIFKTVPVIFLCGSLGV